MSMKHLLGLSCAVCALTVAQAAAAQEADKPADSQAAATAEDEAQEGDAEATPRGQKGRVRVEERDIVVSGNRFRGLMEEPQNTTIITAEDRNLAGVGDFTQLLAVQPGFNYTDDFGINVRGVGRQTGQTLLGQENTVIPYVDGFINLVPSNIGESTLFGGHVTFVRGPAGTTYGRNALGGAVNVLSRAPTREYTAQLVAGVARGGGYNIGMNLAGPVTDNLGFRVGMQRYVQPSIATSVGNGVKGAGFAENNRYIEFQLEWRPGIFHFRNRLTTFSYDNQPGYASLSRYANNLNGNSTPVFGALAPNPAYGLTAPAPSGPYETNVNVAGYDKLRDNFQNILNADVDLDFATLYFVGGYQTYKSMGQSDQDYTSRTSYNADTVAPGNFAAGAQIPTDYRTNYYNDNHFWSTEARLESKPGGPLKWVLGYYHFQQNFDEQYWENIVNATDPILNPVNSGGLATVYRYPTGTTPPPNPRRSTFEQRNIYNIRSNAVFGNVTWDINESWRFDGGLRYTIDDKDAINNFRYVFYYPPLYAGDFTPRVNGGTPRQTDKGLSGRAAIGWRDGMGNQIYASYSRGYQSSAFTLGQGTAGPDPTDPANISEPSFLNVFELGSNWTVGKLRFDGALFYQIFEDQQVPVTARRPLSITSPTDGITRTGLTTFGTFANAQRTDIWGGELQVSWRPNVQSNITFSYTYLNAKFKRFSGIADAQQACNAGPIVAPAQCLDPGAPNYFTPTNPNYGRLLDLGGNILPRTPRNKVSVYGYYGIDMGSAGKIYPGGSIYYQDAFYTNIFNTNRVQSRVIANLTFTYRTADDRLDLSGGVSNLFDRRYADSSALETFGTGVVTQVVSYRAPRFWWATMRYRF